MVERQRVADVLTGIGWCLLAGYMVLAVSQVNDVREFNDDFAQSFAEQVAFVAQVAFPVSTVLLVLAAVAALASQLVRAGARVRTPWRAVPLAWATIAVAALAALTLILAVWSLTEVDGGANKGVQFLLYIGSAAVLGAVPLASLLAIRLEPLSPVPARMSTIRATTGRRPRSVSRRARRRGSAAGTTARSAPCRRTAAASAGRRYRRRRRSRPR